MTRVLFVCLGNICRSPSAQGVFERRLRDRGLAERFEVDSAGTGDWHVGNPPDRRAIAAARKRGYEIAGLRARQVSVADFQRFDLILAMDQSNLSNLQRLVPAGARARTELFMHFAPGLPVEVPDPYYGGDDGFEQVLDMLEQAADGLIEHCLGQA